MEIIKILNTIDAVNLLSGNYMEVISKYLAVAAMPILVIALINCFFGQKLFKILVGIAGIFIGAGLGAGICIGFNLLVKKDMPSVSMIVISIILGVIILGFVSFKLYKAGAFCMGFISGVILGISVMKLMNKDDYLIAAVIGGLLMGLLAIDLYKHMVIILTSVNGGLIAAACIAIITKNDDPLFMLKLGLGLSIGGIAFQYILTLFGKKKNKDEDEEEDEDEDEKQEKRKKADKRVAKTKQKKDAKKPAKQEEKKAKKKANVKSDKNFNKREAAVKKKENSGAGFFLIDIIIEVAQGIKDRVNSYLNADDIEDEDADVFDDNEEYEEDDEYEDYEADEDYEEIDEYEDEDDEEIEEDIEDEDKNYKQIKRDIVYKDQVSEKIEKDIRYQNKRPYYDNNFSIKDKKIVIKEDETKALFQDIEPELTHKIEENINIPIFDVDEIGARLEEELENNLKNQKDEELEELIIKQTIKDIDL